MFDGHLDGGEAWYVPLTPSWNPLKWPRFQFNPVMFRAMPLILRFFELIKLVPEGTEKTQVMLQAGGVGCAQAELGTRRLSCLCDIPCRRKGCSRPCAAFE